MRVVLAVSASASSGGAGLQIDIRTLASLGVHPASVVTAITAQNTVGVQRIYPLPPSVIRSQMDSVFSDMEVGAVKIGMLYDRKVVEEVIRDLKRWKAQRIVLDPVMSAQSDGSSLLKKDAIPSLKRLCKLSSIITPNLPEAEFLSGVKIHDVESSIKAASKIACKVVLIKSIPSFKKYRMFDVLICGKKPLIFEKKRIQRKGTYGGGCALSSAIAANLALGYELPEAVERAERFLMRWMRRESSIGRGIKTFHVEKA